MVKRYWVPAVGGALGLGGLILFFKSKKRLLPTSKSSDSHAAAKSRAYLSLLETEFTWGTDEETKDTATVTLRWENVGLTPAYNVGVTHALEFVPASKLEDGASSSPGFPLQPSLGRISMQPGESTNLIGGHVPSAMTRKWIAGEYAILVYSSAIYSDISGQENRIDSCYRATCQDINGQRIVTLKAAQFNNAVAYGV